MFMLQYEKKLRQEQTSFQLQVVFPSACLSFLAEGLSLLHRGRLLHGELEQVAVPKCQFTVKTPSCAQSQTLIRITLCVLREILFVVGV